MAGNLFKFWCSDLSVQRTFQVKEESVVNYVRILPSCKQRATLSQKADPKRESSTVVYCKLDVVFSSSALYEKSLKYHSFTLD